MEDSLKKRYSIKLFANIVSGLISVILVAIVPKALGPLAYGHFSYLQQFFTQLIAFLDAGSSTAFFTKLSAKRERKELISFYFIFSIVLAVFLLLTIYMLDEFGFGGSLLPGIPSEYIYLGLWFGFFSWMTQIFIKISDAYALTVSVELFKIIHKLIMLALIIYVIHELTFNLATYYYFQYFSLISFFIILTVLFIKKKIFSNGIAISKVEYKDLIFEFKRFCSPLLVFNVVAIAVGLFDIWLLQKTSGSIETGFYGLAYSIATICFLFTSAMTPIITREFSKSYDVSSIADIRRVFKKYIPMMYALASFFGVFVAFEAENILDIFTDKDFDGAYSALVVLAFYPLHQTYGQLSGSLFFATEKTRLYRNIGMTSSFIGLVFTFLFIYLLELGAMGFAWKMVLIQIISVNIQLLFNTKLLKLRLSHFIYHQFYTVVFFSVLAWLSSYIVPELENSVLELLFSGVMYLVMAMIGAIIFPSIFRQNKIKFLRREKH